MLFTLALIAVMAGTATQRLEPAFASIEGIVVKAGSGEPLAGANVELHPAKAVDPSSNLLDFHQYNVKTGDDGKFVISNVAPGTYRLTATRSGGYVPAEYGQRTPTTQGMSFDVVAGQKMTDIRLAMSSSGSITGRVYDSDGEPVGKAQVQALRPIYRDGRRTLTIVQSVQTDDRGEYRLFWLAPGRYYVSARPDIPELPADLRNPFSNGVAVVHITEPARFGTYEQGSTPAIRKRRLTSGEVVEETSLPVYYPGSVEAQSASAVSVSAGGTTAGIDISSGTGLVRAQHIRGRVINAGNGQPLARANISAIPLATDPLHSIPAAMSDQNGLFDLPGVTAGVYFVTASTGRLSGLTQVQVGNADLDNIAIVAGPGFNISGRFVIDGSPSAAGSPKMADLRVSQFTREPKVLGMPLGGPSYNPPPLDDGSFTVEGVAAGDFRVTIRGVPQDGYVKSIRMGNADVLDGGLHLAAAPENPMDIVIGLNAGRVQGVVVNARQEPLSNRSVVLVPDVQLRHRSDLYRVTTTDSSGRFQMRGITPGNYQLFAWDDVESGAWQDPDFIRTYEGRGKLIQLNEGSDESVQLTVIP